MDFEKLSSDINIKNVKHIFVVSIKNGVCCARIDVKKRQCISIVKHKGFSQILKTFARINKLVLKQCLSIDETLDYPDRQIEHLTLPNLFQQNNRLINKHANFLISLKVECIDGSIHTNNIDCLKKLRSLKINELSKHANLNELLNTPSLEYLNVNYEHTIPMIFDTKTDTFISIRTHEQCLSFTKICLENRARFTLLCILRNRFFLQKDLCKMIIDRMEPWPQKWIDNRYIYFLNKHDKQYSGLKRDCNSIIEKQNQLKLMKEKAECLSNEITTLENNIREKRRKINKD